MIAPKSNLAPRSERPALDFRRSWRLQRPIPRRRIKAQFDARVERVRTLIESARKCETRESLESLLGSPVYAMQGQLYGYQALRPDVVEVYQKDGCTIDLWFKDGKICLMSGAPSPTMWDYLLRLAGTGGEDAEPWGGADPPPN